ncbi:uncharacterized protein V6R79_021767 [Siganus canaliculatus]
MDQVTFVHDAVLSDVHMLLPNTQHIMTRLNGAAQPVFITKFPILSNAEMHPINDKGTALKGNLYHGQKDDPDKATNVQRREDGEDCSGALLDADGDLDITHRKKPINTGGRDLVCPIILQQSDQTQEQDEQEVDEVPECYSDVIRIEHTMATPLEDVGKQVWRGALLLADFILSKSTLFKGTTVLELGAGTGFTSIIMATAAKVVYCTDVGEDLLDMCKRNARLNRHMLRLSGGELKVRHLDWLQQNLCTVCYDDDLSDGFFSTLYRLCSNFTHICTIFISIEKRMNFSLRHMDVSCEAYDHFIHCLSQIQDLSDGRCSFTVEQVPTSFPQFFVYERIEHLELWKVTAVPVPFVNALCDSASPMPAVKQSDH